MSSSSHHGLTNIQNKMSSTEIQNSSISIQENITVPPPTPPLFDWRVISETCCVETPSDCLQLNRGWKPFMSENAKGLSSFHNTRRTGGCHWAFSLKTLLFNTPLFPFQAFSSELFCGCQSHRCSHGEVIKIRCYCMIDAVCATYVLLTHW